MRVADARDRQWDILRDAGGLPVGGWCRATCRRGDDHRWFVAWL
jgi:hypothetical protein